MKKKEKNADGEISIDWINEDLITFVKDRPPMLALVPAETLTVSLSRLAEYAAKPSMSKAYPKTRRNCL